MSASPFVRPHFVVNARGASARASRRLDRIREAVAGQLPHAVWAPTTGAGDATRLAADAVTGGADIVVAVGGDGTINEVVNGLMAAPGGVAVLGILPAGSGSDFARTLGLPRDVRSALDVLARGRTRRIDLGLVECAPLHALTPADRSRRYFVNTANCGASSQVVAQFNRRSIPGAIGYAVATALAAAGYRPPEVEIGLGDGPAERVRLNVLFVCNGEYCGAGMHVGRGALLDDGMLRLVVASGLGRLSSLRQWPRLYRGLEGVAGVRFADARTIHVRSREDVLVDGDGELFGRLPATFQVVPGALTVCVP